MAFDGNRSLFVRVVGVFNGLLSVFSLVFDVIGGRGANGVLGRRGVRTGGLFDGIPVLLRLAFAADEQTHCQQHPK